MITVSREHVRDSQAPIVGFQDKSVDLDQMDGYPELGELSGESPLPEDKCVAFATSWTSRLSRVSALSIVKALSRVRARSQSSRLPTGLPLEPS